jgi:Protein of unknown function (DUF1350)
LGADNIFELVGNTSWVAKRPNPIGVVEFIGGALLGTAPIVGYDYFLRTLYDANYTVIATAFRFGLNHEEVAQDLLHEHQKVLDIKGINTSAPRFWVGHSLGCKYITLLESSGDIMDQPSLLIAPDISDTRDAVPLPFLPEFLDTIGKGVTPSRQKIKELLKTSHLFNLTALISFDKDTVAGTMEEPPETSDVALFIHELENQDRQSLFKAQLTGGHFEIAGLRVRINDQDYLVDLDPFDGILEPTGARNLEAQALKFLEMLAHKLP